MSTETVLLAAGMFGATVMPHIVYLPSVLSRDRFGRTPDTGRVRLLGATRIDVGLAMVVARGLRGRAARSGLASTSVGRYAGAVIMEGLLIRWIPLLARRVVTLVPAHHRARRGGGDHRRDPQRRPPLADLHRRMPALVGRDRWAQTRPTAVR